jgi:hypothetical protein
LRLVNKLPAAYSRFRVLGSKVQGLRDSQNTNGEPLNPEPMNL